MKKLLQVFTFLLLIPHTNFGQNYNIGEQTLFLMDSSRNRLVKTEIWYPTNETDSSCKRKTELPFILSSTIRDANFLNQPLPLVLISHGTGGNRFSLAWLAIALAKQGYIVVAPDHWGNTFDNKIPDYFVRYWERPLDISFLINHLHSTKILSEQIDWGKIGMAGFSFGGYTTLALAGAEIDCNILKKASATEQGKKEFSIPELGDLRKLINKIPCDNIPIVLKDTRIKAFVAFAPALGLGFESTEQTKTITSPMLIIGAENDQIAPIKTNAEKYYKLIQHSSFILLEGKVGHYVFLNEGSNSLKKEAKKYYNDDKLVSRFAIHNKIETEVITFFKNNL